MPKPHTRKMKSSIRAIVHWATKHGWVLQDKKDGSGHWVLRHPSSGATVRLPDTPGEHRGLENAKAEIRRKSGLPNDSGPAARYRHEGRRRHQGFDMDAAVREARLRRALEEAEALRRAKILVQIKEARHALGMINPRRDPELARELATRIVDLERQLNTA